MHVARRALHGAIVAGVLAGGMAFSGGIASADTCTSSSGDTYTGASASDILESGLCNPLSIDSLTKVVPTPTTTPSPVTLPTSTSAAEPTSKTNTPPPEDKGTSNGGGPVGPPQQQGGGAVVAQPAAQSASGASGASLAAAPAAGSLPADSALLTAPAFGAAPTGVYDPALLLGAPGMTPLVQAASADPASAVTTASQVQAMALTNVPKELGIPAVIGVIILAGLGAFVVRHRVLRRVKKAATS